MYALPVLVGAALLGCVLGYLEKLPCRSGGWGIENYSYTHGCYTDIYPLYFVEKLSDGQIPYVDHHVEYPVLIGGAMQFVAWIVSPITDPLHRGAAFYDVTAALLTLAAIVAVVATAVAAGRRRWKDALLLALAPGLILSAFINWDLLAVALTAIGMACWARRRPVLAGVAIGLAVATKFYPLLVLGPLLLLCLRAGRMRAYWQTLGGAAVAWVAVNLPVYRAAPDGWATFYTFSRTRGADWGSIWYFFQSEHVPFLGTTQLHRLNEFGSGAFIVCCVAIALLALRAANRPRVGQLCFLVVAAFLLTNKVWSPQYVLWLLPFVVLARPRVFGYVLWQLAEIGYFLAIWWYLLGFTTHFAQGIGNGAYFTALLARSVTVLLLVVLVVVDMLARRPDAEAGGGAPDPGGGVLDGAPDVFTLRRRRPTVAALP